MSQQQLTGFGVHTASAGLQYCNSVLPESIFTPLQWVQNTAARFVLKISLFRITWRLHSDRYTGCRCRSESIKYKISLLQQFIRTNQSLIDLLDTVQCRQSRPSVCALVVLPSLRTVLFVSRRRNLVNGLFQLWGRSRGIHDRLKLTFMRSLINNHCNNLPMRPSRPLDNLSAMQTNSDRNCIIIVEASLLTESILFKRENSTSEISAGQFRMLYIKNKRVLMDNHTAH